MKMCSRIGYLRGSKATGKKWWVDTTQPRLWKMFPMLCRHHRPPPTTYHLPHTTTNHHHLTTTAATCRNSKTTIIIIIMIIRKQTATTASSNETLSLQQVLIKSTKTGAKEVLYGLIVGLSTVQNAHHWRQKSWDWFQHLHIEIPMTGCWAFSAGLMMVTSLLSKADRSSVHFGATALNS